MNCINPKNRQDSRHLPNIRNICPVAVFCAICFLIPVILYQKCAVPAVQPDVPYVRSEQEILLPEVLYLPSEEAVAQLEALGLQVAFRESVYHPVIPEHQVLTQQPQAGSVLQPGEVVTLVCSNGWTQYVPDVQNFMQEDAIALLTEAGFVTDYEIQSSESNAPGTVIAQDAAPGGRIAPGSKIHLIISGGREDLDVTRMESVGYYIGMDFEAAKSILSASCLYALQTDTAYCPDMPGGRILKQELPAGSQVCQGTIIRMTVSLGQEIAIVPDCVQQDAAAARTLLEAAGFCCVIQYVPDDTAAMDCILSQSAEAGSRLPAGSPVILTASVGTSSYVISTGGWSGNPLPIFTTEATEVTEETEIITEPEPEEIPPVILPEEIPVEIPVAIPDMQPVPEPQEPEQPTMPVILPPEELILPEETTTESEPVYQEAPETAPF